MGIKDLRTGTCAFWVVVILGLVRTVSIWRVMETWAREVKLKLGSCGC